MRAIANFAAAYKLVWVRVLFYFLIPSVNTFLSITETWSGQTWAETPVFLRARLFAACFISGATAFAAYIDSSLGRARADHEERKMEVAAQQTI